MGQTLRILKTAVKTAFLSTALFALYSEIYYPTPSFFALVIYLCVMFIVTSVLSVIFIIVSIVPITIFDDKRSKKEQFARYFPYYTMLFFTGITTLSIYAEFDRSIVIILVIAYITAAQSWIWLFKE